MYTSFELSGSLSDRHNHDRTANKLASQIAEVLADDNTDSHVAITMLLAEELLGLKPEEEDVALWVEYLSSQNTGVLTPLAEKALEQSIPANIDDYPLSKQRMLNNYSASGLRPIAHFASSLIDELQSNGDQSQVSIEKILALELACTELLNDKHKGGNLTDLTDLELRRNQENLAALGRIAEREGVAIDPERLMRIQPEIFEMLTSNDPVTTVDVNYRKRLNSMPNAARSLQAPDLPNTSKLLSRYGNYIDFIEATAATKRGGYASTFGFLHKVDADEMGNPFIIEYPHTMFDKEILSIDHPVVDKLMSFENDFQRTHDMLHNALPVYADHFMIHHPTAPITLGGYLPDYVEFGKGMRKDKSSYELSLAILHKQIMQDRFEQDPSLLAEHIAAAGGILDDLMDLQANTLCSDKAIDHVSFVVMSAAMNIISCNDHSSQELLDKYDRLNLPSTIVRPSDVYKLLVQQEVVVVDEALMNDISDQTSVDQRIGLVCARINESVAVEALQNPTLDYSTGEQGAEYIVKALREMGIEPIGMNEQFVLSGRDRLRWTSITASSRRLKGFNEKIHGLQSVRYWDSTESCFTEIKPVELLGRFYDHFQQNAQQYDYRVWFRGLSNATLAHFKHIAFNTDNETRELIAREHPAAFGAIDQCISSLIEDNYLSLSTVDVSELHALSKRMHSLGHEDISNRIKISLQAYEVLVHEAERTTEQTGRTFVEARSELEKQLMSLDG